MSFAEHAACIWLRRAIFHRVSRQRCTFPKSEAGFVFWRSVACPTCFRQVAFDDADRFVNSLISHGTLAAMVDRYRREEKAQRHCNACHRQLINTSSEQVCEQCQLEHEQLRRTITENMHRCDALMTNENLTSSMANAKKQMNVLQTIIQRRTKNWIEILDKYHEELNSLLKEQQPDDAVDA